MRILLTACAGIAGFGLLLGAAPASVRRPAFNRGVAYATPAPCPASTPAESFVGTPGQENYAGGVFSAVVGGTNNSACNSKSMVGAGVYNQIGNTGDQAFIAGGYYNEITGINSFVGNGYFNIASSGYSFIGSGIFNSTAADGAFIGAGGYTFFLEHPGTNTAYGNTAAGQDSFVGSGDLNSVTGAGSFIGGGGTAYALTGATAPNNQVAGVDSFVGDGDGNSVAANEAVVVGGKGNIVEPVASYASIGGGYANLASGSVASIPGGYHNVASGFASFAAGYVAEATTNGSFVWSDESSTSVHVKTTVPNQFLARAAGGVIFFTSPSLSSGAQLPAGSGSWASLSDRAAKTGVSDVDDARILAKVAALPVSEWSYVTERGVRHVGPMAQDFYAAFGVGEDDRHIATIDEDGVALAAIKALHSENVDLRAENGALRTSLKDMRARDDARFAALERRVDALAAASNRGQATR